MTINLQSSEEDLIIHNALQITYSRLKTQSMLLNNHELVTQYLTLKLATLEHEVFGCLFLNIKKCLITDEQLFRGTINHCQLYPREIIKSVVNHNAHSVILYHNHPSGDADPSQLDFDITKLLTNYLTIIDVKIADHIIIAGKNYYSFHQNKKI